MSSVHFVGHSLGGIVGGVYLGVSSAQVKTATLAMPGGKLSSLLIDSATFGPRITAALGASGLTPNTTLFNQFLRDVQKLKVPVRLIALHIKQSVHAEVVRDLEALGLPNLEIRQIGKTYHF